MRLIDADALLKRWDEMSVRGRTEFDQEIMIAPSVIPKPKEGEWVVDISDYKSVCPVCGAKETEFIYGTEMWYGLGESKYCPNCGAKMKGAE